MLWKLNFKSQTIKRKSSYLLIRLMCVDTVNVLIFFVTKEAPSFYALRVRVLLWNHKYLANLQSSFWHRSAFYKRNPYVWFVIILLRIFEDQGHFHPKISSPLVVVLVSFPMMSRRWLWAWILLWWWNTVKSTLPQTRTHPLADPNNHFGISQLSRCGDQKLRFGFLFHFPTGHPAVSSTIILMLSVMNLWSPLLQ